MKVERYAVSIQYGSGMHSFLRTDLTDYQEAQLLRQQHEKRCLEQWKKGAKPKAYAWGRIDLPQE